MKDYLQLIAVFAVLLLLIPCVGYARRESEKAAAGGSQGYETVIWISRMIRYSKPVEHLRSWIHWSRIVRLMRL